MERIKLNNKNIIIRVDDIEYVGTSSEGIRVVNTSGREYNIYYQTNPAQEKAKLEDYLQLERLLVTTQK